MPNKATYEYAVIRLVPKVEREEFLNIGVILMSRQKKYLDIKYQVNDARIRAFDQTIDLDLVRKYLQAWASVCRGAPEGGQIGQLDLHERFRWLTAARSTIIQSSKVHPGRCEDPAAVLKALFERYVAQ
jgi:hypothetical protein